MSGLSAGGNTTLTQAQVESILIQPLAQKSSYLSVGFDSYSSAGEAIKIPTLTTAFSASLVAEGGTISATTPVTSEITLLPSTVYAAKMWLPVSNEILNQSFLSVQQTFGQLLVDAVARKIDAALYNGGGTGGTALGICQMTGVTNAGTVAGTAITSGTLYDMQNYAELAYTDASQLYWLMSPTTAKRVRNLTDNYGSRVWQPSLAAGSPGTLLGFGYTVTTAMPDTSLILVDRSQVAVGIDTSASVTFHPDTLAQQDMSAVRVTFRADTQPKNATGIIRLTLS